MAKISNVFQQTEIKKETHPRRITKWIHYTKLKSNAAQYCDAKDKEEIESLADLIEADGEVLQDLLVRKMDTDEYVIIAGHKRRLACKLLVEEREKKEFAFLPCIEKDISDVRAEFQVYSSNGHHVETAYETMHKLERMKYLLEHYPEEFPNMQTGRMVERLARQYGMSRATVGEYQTIASRLCDKAMELFKKEEIDKSAAVTLARMPEEQQEEVLDKGIRVNVEIQEYQAKNFEFSCNDVLATFGLLGLDKIDTDDRKGLAKLAADSLGKGHFVCKEGGYVIKCTPEHISLDGKKKMSWAKYMRLVDQYIPKPSEQTQEPVDLMELIGDDEPEEVPENIPEKRTYGTGGNQRQSRADKEVRPDQEEKPDTQERHPCTYIRVLGDVIERIQIHHNTYVFVQNKEVQTGSRAMLIEMDPDGRTTGNQTEVSVLTVETWETNPALQKGYQVLYVEEI